MPVVYKSKRTSTTTQKLPLTEFLRQILSLLQLRMTSIMTLNQPEIMETNSENLEIWDTGTTDDEDEYTKDEDDSDDDICYPETEPETDEKKTEMPEQTHFGYNRFSLISKVHLTHSWIQHTPIFTTTHTSSTGQKELDRVWEREVKLLREGIPEGIFVKSYEDRKDLFSALIMGPAGTPYEGGVFVFDIKLPQEYPQRPPLFYFFAFPKGQLNPNLHPEDGTVGMSLLETWNGWEEWVSEKSSLLQVLVLIQKKILVPEPFYNGRYAEATDSYHLWPEMSRQYNENTVTLLLQGMIELLQNPPLPWSLEIVFILKEEIARTISRLKSWLKVSFWIEDENDKMKNTTKENKNHSIGSPTFPLIPFSSRKSILYAIKALKRQHDTLCNI